MDPPMDPPSCMPVHDVDPQVLIAALKSHLPYSLPLLRRLQHSLAHPSPTAKYLATATVLDAAGDLKPASDRDSVSASLVPRGSLSGKGKGDVCVGVPTPWLAAWVDLQAGPETQVVVYSSLEGEAQTALAGKAAPAVIENSDCDSDSPPVSTLHYHPTPTGKISPDPLPRVRAQLLALLSHIKNRLMPEYLQSFTPSPAPESARDANNTNQIGASRAASATKSGNDSRPKAPGPQPFGPRAFKIGHLHTGLFSVLTASGKYPPPSPPLDQDHGSGSGAGPTATTSHPHGPQMVVPGLRVHRFDQPPYQKYLFREEEFVIADGDHVAESDKAVIQNAGSSYPARSTSDSAVAVNPVNCEPNSKTSHRLRLPPGYRFSDRKGSSALLPRHYELICRRSAVFRTPKSLASFVGVAVYVDDASSSCSSDTEKKSKSTSDDDDDDEENEDKEDPIAWAFISADGALTVLNVDPAHRGKGVAESASREVLRRGMREGGMFRAEGEKGWAHADVAPGNRASCRVMEKLGGVLGWTVTWMVVEVE